MAETDTLRKLIEMGGGYVVAAVTLWILYQIAKDFKSIVQANTAAITQLCSLVESLCEDCPQKAQTQKRIVRIKGESHL